jgi:hypothetical protein
MGTAASTIDFVASQKRYVDVGVDEQDMFRVAEPEVKYKEPDEDFYTALSGDEFKKKALEIVERVHARFSSK